METRYTVQQTVEMTGISHMFFDTGRKSWNCRSTEMRLVNVITPDMIFNFL